MRIAFFGTPDYTTVFLDCLQGMAEVVAVVTAPDRPSGRGRGLHRPGPALWADEHGVPCLQPETPREPELATRLAALAPDLGVVVAYGRILPRAVFALPVHETINVHFSLLPAFRGASPIEAALLCGQATSGVTVQRIVEKLDAGDILDREPVTIDPLDHFPELFAKLLAAGLTVLPRAVRILTDGTANYQPQIEADADCCGKISSDERRIDWNCGRDTVYNRIRAYAGHRTAWTTFRGHKLLVHRAAPADETVVAPGTTPGTAVKVERHALAVACGDGKCVALVEVQPENRKRMSVSDWINGIKPNAGECLQ